MPPHAGVDLVAAAKELRIGAVDCRFERADRVVLDFGAHEAADLHAGLRAWNVIKAVAVKRTNSYVLYSLALTGISAACAPTTAISPATLPSKRRLAPM
jgi:hypothetical protein